MKKIMILGGLFFVAELCARQQDGIIQEDIKAHIYRPKKERPTRPFSKN